MEVTLSSILTDIGSIGTSALEWMGGIVDFITANPLPFVMVTSFFFIGGAVGLVRRIIG